MIIASSMLGILSNPSLIFQPNVGSKSRPLVWLIPYIDEHFKRSTAAAYESC